MPPRRRNYQASSTGGAVPWTAPRGRESCWVNLGCCKCDSGTVANMLTALSAVTPSATAALIGFMCPQQHRLRRAEVARVGFLVAPRHYCGQDIPAIGIWHQHSPAKALFAGFRFRNKLPRRVHTSARINSGGIRFCLCRSNAAYASEAFCTDVTPSMPISGVR